MHSENIRIDNYSQNGNYSFQYCKNVEIHNAVINSKDAFWNTENVTVYDSELNGVFGVALSQSTSGKLQNLGNAAALLCSRPCYGELYDG